LETVGSAVGGVGGDGEVDEGSTAGPMSGDFEVGIALNGSDVEEGSVAGVDEIIGGVVAAIGENEGAGGEDEGERSEGVE